MTTPKYDTKVSRALEVYPNKFDPSRMDNLEPRLRSIVERRMSILGPGYSLIYRNPVEFVEGRGAHLFDREGNDFLDAYNNVACVGHSHPHVVEAITSQIKKLNTNNRYVQESLVDYAERLVATFPEELSRVTFGCSGSEANDLAIRVAKFYTRNQGIIVTRNAYHGITSEVASFSPGLGPTSPIGPNVVLIEAPDPRVAAAEGLSIDEYMRKEIKRGISELARHGFGLAAFVADSLFTSDGIFADPTSYLKPMIEEVHAAGGLYIADEVQSGFGRCGDAMWGFQRHGIIPDIVTLGKPMGNGLPLSGTVFRPEVAYEFGQNCRYFNTFAASQLPIAAGAAVLDVISSENLLENAIVQGDALRKGLHEIVKNSPHVSDIRGVGLYTGVEIVADRDSGSPDKQRTEKFIDELRERRILIRSCGGDGNVLKIRPPLVFNSSDVTRFLETFSDIAKELL